MRNQDFNRAVSEAREDLARQRMPAAAASRVRARIDRQAGRRTRARLVQVALVAAGVAAALVLVRARPRTDRALALPVAMPAGFETLVRSPDLELAAGDDPATVAVRVGSCTLRLPGWGRITVGAGTRLRRDPGGVSLLTGAADFQVDKRAPSAGSTQVRLPQGSIEITGTHFSVVQRDDGGSASLFEGEIRFHSPDGRTVTLVPGQSLRWPLPPVALPGAKVPAAPPTPEHHLAKRITTAAAPVTRNIVDRISTLRAEGRYGELAAELRRSMNAETLPRTRERLSFELGTVLSYHLPDRAAACAHWAEHARAFPTGHYAPEVSDAQKTLHCE